MQNNIYTESQENRLDALIYCTFVNIDKAKTKVTVVPHYCM